MKRPAVCFFDVDHTITRGSTGRHFAFKAVRAGYIHASALLSIPLFYFKYRLGLVRDDDLVGEFSILKGIPRKELEDLGHKTFRQKIVGDIYPQAGELIQSLRDEGSEIVIATSSLDLVVEPLADHLGIDTVLASSLEYSDGKCTGRFEGKLYFGENKKTEALEYLRSRKIDPGDCAFYSDSIHDLPLLECVGLPVAVNPDVRLTRHASEKGWEIIRFR